MATTKDEIGSNVGKEQRDTRAAVTDTPTCPQCDQPMEFIGESSSAQVDKKTGKLGKADKFDEYTCTTDQTGVHVPVA